jgi:hypothetical protein
MGIVIPTVDEVVAEFENTLARHGNAGANSVMAEYDQLYRSALNPEWDDRGFGISVLPVSGRVRLVRVVYVERIDDHMDGQLVRIRQAIRDLESVIVAAIPPGTHVYYRFEHGKLEAVPAGQRVTLFAYGVVR